MEEELDLDLDSLESNAENKLKVKNRFEKLSEKVILTSKERDEALAKVKAEAEARTKAEKEAEFYKGFSANITKYPQATEYQDQILDKVRGGYTPEDAMVAVLAKEGKLNVQPEVRTPSQQVEGGSAPTAIEGNKSIDSMTSEEKFDALKGLNNDQIFNALRGR